MLVKLIFNLFIFSFSVKLLFFSLVFLKYKKMKDDSPFCILFNSIEPFQNDGRVIIKRCMQWNPVYDCKDFIL